MLNINSVPVLPPSSFTTFPAIYKSGEANTTTRRTATVPDWRHSNDNGSAHSHAANATSTRRTQGWPSTIHPPPGSGSVTTTPTTSQVCTSLPDGFSISFVVVHTETITFFGSRNQYHPPFTSLSLPNFCTAAGPAQHSGASGRLGGLVNPGDTTGTGGGPGILHVVTLITTDKNPAVVFPTQPVPHYSYPSGAQVPEYGPESVNLGEHQNLGPAGGAATEVGAFSSYVVTALGSQVVINRSTFSSLRPSQTTTVTADGGTFTILPTAIVGEGQTVLKPDPASSFAIVPTPTTTVLQGIPVTASGTDAIVGGTSFNMPIEGTSGTVQGQRVSIAPGTIIVGDQTATFAAAVAVATNEVVEGGGLLMVVGSSIAVLHSTTFTFGRGIPAITRAVDGDVVSIGPLGVRVDGTTLGGPGTNATETAFRIVGGVSITESGASVVMVGNKTFTVGPGVSLATTAVDNGTTITLGTNGFTMSTLTLTYPFQSRVTTTIQPSGTYATMFPAETQGTAGDDEEDLGFSLRPLSCFDLLVLCTATGVWLWI